MEEITPNPPVDSAFLVTFCALAKSKSLPGEGDIIAECRLRGVSVRDNSKPARRQRIFGYFLCASKK